MKKIPLKKRGIEVLLDPLTNKGAAFTNEERSELGLHGLLPVNVATMEEQLCRRYENFRAQPSNIAKYTYLAMLQNRNETLFYKMVKDHVEEMLPLIYTPTVGEVSQRYSFLYSHSRGVYISYPMRDQMDQLIENIASAKKDGVDVIVVTDGERILGLGDLGAGGMAISVGKLALYSLFGGINPAKALPIVLDVGTNNEALIGDPLYIGWRNPRISGADYDDFIGKFVAAVKKRWPNVLLQWEDFGRNNASRILKKYQDKICSFNDDIQGTAAVVLAATYAAVKRAGKSITDQKVVVLGAGSAGLGICNQLQYAMEQEGLSKEEAKKRFFLIDKLGLVHSGCAHAEPAQKEFAQDLNDLKNWKPYNSATGSFVNDPISLLDVIENAHPTILVGVCTKPGAFTEEMIRTMAKYVDRPVIFPLSNPTSKSEAIPADLMEWTDGKAIIATGSPFPEVEFKGSSYRIAQCNNVYVFPGVGLGVIACGATQVSDSMFLAASKALAEHAPILSDPQGGLFPSFLELDTISREIAIAVAKQAMDEGFAKRKSQEEIERAIDAIIWRPVYPTYYAAD